MKRCASLFFLLLTLSFSVPVSAASSTEDQIAKLKAQIELLRRQLNGETSVVPKSFARFDQTFILGSSGSEVKRLQEYLNQYEDTRIALRGAGSPGNETLTYGVLTKEAVRKFQLKHNISPATGEFDDITRITLNSLAYAKPVSSSKPVAQTPSDDLTTLEGLPFSSVPMFNAELAAEQGLFEGNLEKDWEYYQKEADRYALIFKTDTSTILPSNEARVEAGNAAVLGDSSTPLKILNIARMTLDALLVRNFSGKITRPPHFCTCTLTPLIFVKAPGKPTKTLALFPVPGKTIFAYYNFFTPRVATLGEYYESPVKIPCLQGFPPACVPDKTVKNIDGAVKRMGTSLSPTK